MTIGERILVLIKDRGMTQKEFSKRTGIPQSTISDWKGKKLNQSSDKIVPICDALDIDPYALLTSTDDAAAKKAESIRLYAGSEEYGIIQNYRRLGRNRQNRLKGYLDALCQERK